MLQAFVLINFAKMYCCTVYWNVWKRKANRRGTGRLPCS